MFNGCIKHHKVHQNNSVPISKQRSEMNKVIPRSLTDINRYAIVCEPSPLGYTMQILKCYLMHFEVNPS